MLQITKYIRQTRALSRISRASWKLRKHVFTKTWNWKVAGILASILKVPEKIEDSQKRLFNLGKLRITVSALVNGWNIFCSRWENALSD